MKSHRTGILAILALLALALTACDTDDGDPFDHSCEGAGRAADTTDHAAASQEGSRTLSVNYSQAVTLLPDEPGWVDLDAWEPMTVHVFAGQTDIVTGFWDGDTDLGLPAGSPNPKCPDAIPVYWDVELEVGVPLYLMLAPAGAEDTIWLYPIQADAPEPSAG